MFKGLQHVANKFRLAEKKGFTVDGEFNQSELFGQSIFPAGSARQITLTEGYDDAMAAFEMQGSKYPCVSVHSASTAAHDVAKNFEYLNAFEEIVICFDKDEGKHTSDGSTRYPGQEAAIQVAGMFPLGKVRILTLSKAKDANDYLRAGLGKSFIDEWWKAPKYTPAGLKLPKDMWEAVSARKNNESVPYPWDSLNTFTYGIRLSEWVLITAETGVGKALSLDTEIPTPDGWLTMGEVEIGDTLYDRSGKECHVTFVTPVQLNRECYKVKFNDGTEIIADAEHNWLSWNRNVRAKLGLGQDVKPSVYTTEEMKSSLTHGLANNHAIPYGRIEGSYKELPCDPYCFGLWLGDGCSSSAAFYTNDPELVEAFTNNGYRTKKQPYDKYGYTIHGLAEDLRKTGAFNNKHIPMEYLRSSYEQRLALLQGLMDTDGSAPNNKHHGRRCELTSVKPALAETAYELCLSLGLTVTKTEGRATINGRDCGPKWRIGFTTHIPVFRLGRKLKNQGAGIINKTGTYRIITDITPVDSVPVRCIQVDSSDHTFLCSKRMVPTHNTSVVKEIEYEILQKFLKQEVPGKLGLLHLEEANEDTLIGLMSISAMKPLHLPDVRDKVEDTELKNYFDSTCNNDGMVIWDHFGSNSIEAVLNKIRHMHNLGCKYIFFDHLSIVVSDQNGDERKQLDEISTKLKTLCMELNIAVIGVIHQNRQGSIRGSAGPEQLANMVIKLSRDKEDDDPWRRNITKLVVQKNRFCGKTGPACYLEYVPETGRLVELTNDQIKKYESGEAEVSREVWA